MLPLTARVLQLIRSSYVPLAKAEVAEILGTSQSAASMHIDRLLAHKIIKVSRIGPSQGGRKPMQFTINETYGYILSIELRTTFATIAITDFKCEILHKKSIPILIEEGPQKVLPKILQVALSIISSSGLEMSQFKGIGVGLPGPVDFSLGTPIAPPMMPNWDQYPIKEFWGKHFKCPCFVDNDVNNMALGEHSVGLRFSVPHLIFVEAGAGIGAGVVYNGSLYRGADGSAGDIGHFPIGGSTSCWCGRTGCLEAEASLNAIILKETASSGRQTSFEDIKQAFLRLDINTVGLVRNSGQLIGKVIAAIVNFSNPSLIVLGGQLTEFGDVFLASVRQSIYENTMTLAGRHLKINTSVLGNNAGLIGGAHMSIDQLILQVTNNDPDHFF